MQQVFKLDEKFGTKLKHMEEDIEELKSKAINQEGKEMREGWNPKSKACHKTLKVQKAK